MADLRQQMRQMIYGFYSAQVMYVAARLAVADQLADGGRSTEELATALEAHPASLRRLLRALVFLGVLTESVDGFALTEQGQLLRSDVKGSVRQHAMLLCGKENWQSWGELEHSVRTGEVAWEHLYGENSFGYLAAHPEKQAVFNSAMAEGSRVLAPVIAQASHLEDVRTLVDIGGGSGTLIAGVLNAYPHLRGTVFDTEDGLSQTAGVLAESGVADRCDLAAGDFFVEVPEGADAYLLKSILHDWDDEQCVAILSSCRKAMRPDAVLLIAEPVMPEDVEAKPGLLPLMMSDLNMMVCTGGRERSAAEFTELLTAAGFTLDSVTPCAGPAPFSVVRATPTKEWS
jgi:hypothetical protein